MSEQFEGTGQDGNGPQALEPTDSSLELCQLRWLDDTCRPLSPAQRALLFLRQKALGARRRVKAVAARTRGTSPEPYGGRPAWEQREDGTAVEKVRARPSLGLRAGDLVEVRSREEIRSTLDSEGKHDGLKFMRPMGEYCGKRFRVLKPVRLVVDEHERTMKRTRRTVILENGICHGRGLYGREGCDRSCFFFWKEAWLRKIEE